MCFTIFLFLTGVCSAADTWKAPRPGSIEESHIINKAKHITVTAHDGNKYHDVFNVFLNSHCDLVLKEVQDQCDDRDDWLTKNVCGGDYRSVIGCRKQLYGNLYNKLRALKNGSCSCGSHFAQDICYLPALEAELLVNTCIQVAVELDEKDAVHTEKINLNKMHELRGVLAQRIQAELREQKNWEYKPINNTLTDYTHHYAIKIEDWLEKNQPQGPFVTKATVPDKYLDRDMTSNFKADDGNYVIPSRQLWIDTDQIEVPQSSNKKNSKKIRFSDDDWGYDVTLELPHIKRNETGFDITAYEWTTNKEINRCFFAYKRTYWKETINPNMLGAVGHGMKHELVNEFGIAHLHLPFWRERQYGIELLLESECDEDHSEVCVRKGLHQTKHAAIVEGYQCTQVTGEVNALAYDYSSVRILYASGNTLTEVPLDGNMITSLSRDIYTFEHLIKKIFVTSNSIYFVFTSGYQGGKLYRVMERNKMWHVTEMLHLENMLDIAFDTMPVADVTEQRFVVLTKNGVTICPCGYQGENPLIGRDIKHAAFDYATYKYNAIDVQNGQIYVMHRPYVETDTQPEYGHVLIYPPLSVATANSDVSTDTVITIPIDQASSSSSSSSVKQQFTEGVVPCDNTDVIIEIGVCGEEEEDSS